MTDTTIPQAADSVTRYLRFWNTTPAEQRRTGNETFADSVTYVTPAMVMTGIEALADFTEQFVANLGAYQFRTRTAPDVHHDRARVQWEIRVGDDTSFAEGTDILTVGDDGRIGSITSFLDRAPNAQPHH